jgi:hypothetical protein
MKLQRNPLNHLLLRRLLLLHPVNRRRHDRSSAHLLPLQMLENLPTFLVLRRPGSERRQEQIPALRRPRGLQRPR